MFYVSYSSNIKNTDEEIYFIREDIMIMVQITSNTDKVILVMQ